MPNITIRLSDQQLSQLQSGADSANLSINSYILDCLFHEADIDNKLNLTEVINRALRKDSEKEFTIPSLFTYDEWQSFSSADKRMVGRGFFKAAKTKLADEFRFIGKSQNIAAYVRL